MTGQGKSTLLQSPRSQAASNPALRVSGWSEGVEEGPVGFPGVEQDSDAVVGEVGEPERGALTEKRKRHTPEQAQFAPKRSVMNCLASAGGTFRVELLRRW